MSDPLEFSCTVAPGDWVLIEQDMTGEVSITARSGKETACVVLSKEDVLTLTRWLILKAVN